MLLSENEKARPKIILFCEMRAVIKRPKPYHLFYEGMNFKASFTRKNFVDRIISIEAYKGII